MVKRYQRETEAINKHRENGSQKVNANRRQKVLINTSKLRSVLMAACYELVSLLQALNYCHVPGAILGAGDISMNMTSMNMTAE